MSNRLLGVAVVLVGLAGAINALAVKSAAVTNKVTFAVVDTQNAGLAFSGASTDQDPGVTVSYANGSMQFGLAEGIQPNAVYRWSRAFKITNNAENDLTLSYQTATLPAGVTLRLYRSTDGVSLEGTPLVKGSSVDVDVEITTADNASLTGAAPYNLTVTGTRPTAP